MFFFYGFDVFGGVVNIIIKKIGQKWIGMLSVDIIIQEYCDCGDIYNGQFFISGLLIDGVFGMKVYGSLVKCVKDDLQLFSNVIGEMLCIEGFISCDGNVEFVWMLNENYDFIVGYGFDCQDCDFDFFDCNCFEWENYFLSYNGCWDIGNSEFKFYGEKVDNKNSGQSGIIILESNVIDGKYVLLLGMINQLVIFGGEWCYDKLKDLVNLSSGGQLMLVSQYVLFIEDEWCIIELLVLIIGICMDDYQIYGDYWSLCVYLVYNVIDIVIVKGGWVMVFKVLLLLQFNFDWIINFCCGLCSIVGNLDLKLEISESFEFGFYYCGEEGWFENVEGSIIIFQNNVDDMIDVLCIFSVSEVLGYLNFVGWKIVNGKCVLIFCYFNVNKVCIKGVEMEVKILFGDEWKLMVNYIYNDGCDLSNGGDKLLQMLLFYIVNGMFDWKLLDDWFFYVMVNYIGQQCVVSVIGKMLGGYILFDVGVVWQVIKNVKLCFGVQNVGDKDLSWDDYSYIEEGCCYFMVVDYCF